MRQSSPELLKVLLIDMEYVQQSFIKTVRWMDLRYLTSKIFFFTWDVVWSHIYSISLGFFHSSAFSFTKTFPVFGKKNAESSNRIWHSLRFSKCYNLLDCIKTIERNHVFVKRRFLTFGWKLSPQHLFHLFSLHAPNLVSGEDWLLSISCLKQPCFYNNKSNFF